MFPFEIETESPDAQKHEEGKHEQQKADRAFRKHRQSEEQSGKHSHSHLVRLVAPVAITYEICRPRKYEQVEPRIYYSGLEIKERQYGSCVQQNPQQTEAAVFQSPARPEQHKQGAYAANRIRETGSKLVHSENLH